MKRPLAGILLASLALITPAARGGVEEAASKADESVQEALESAKVPCKIDANGDFHLSLKFKDGRSQKIVIVSGRIVLGDEEDGDEMREIFAVAYSAGVTPSGELATKLLEANASEKIGGWAIRRNGEKFEVVYRAFVPADICEDELLPAVTLVAQKADALEKSQTGNDEN